MRERVEYGRLKEIQDRFLASVYPVVKLKRNPLNYTTARQMAESMRSSIKQRGFNNILKVVQQQDDVYLVKRD